MNNPLKEIGFGLVGLGWPGGQHAKAVAALPGTRIAAACDLSPARLAEFSAVHAPERQYADYAALLADPAVDAVTVSLPNFLHASATLDALRAGKHVLCEKPPTMNVAEIEAIRVEARARGLTYAFGRQSRFSAALQAAKAVVAAGTLGEVYLVKAERVRSRGVPAWGGGWFLDKARAGGGAVIDIGVHALDAAWFLLGCPEPLTVSAQVSARFNHLLPEGVTSDVEDNGTAFLRFACGVTMVLEVAWASNATDAVPASTWAGHELENTTLYGSAATLRLSPPTLFTMEGQERRETAYPLGPEVPAFEGQMADFLHAVRTGTPPTNNVDQAVSLMRMLGAIYESSATGREVRLGES